MGGMEQMGGDFGVTYEYDEPGLAVILEEKRHIIAQEADNIRNVVLWGAK